MKRYYLTITIIFLFLYVGYVNVTNASLPLLGKTIVIDPGHGGSDPGTSYEDVLEKDINLNISLKLYNELIKKGASVMLTRNADYDLSAPHALYRKKSDFDNRINLINNSGANYYISIHLNYLNDSKYSGIQVFYDQKNKELANRIQKVLNKKLNSNREIYSIPKNTYMYKKLKVPGVLIECGFLSNTEERNQLKDSSYQLKIASAIADAISSI